MANSKIKYTEEAYDFIDNVVDDFYKFIIRELVIETSKYNKELIEKEDVARILKKALAQVLGKYQL